MARTAASQEGFVEAAKDAGVWPTVKSALEIIRNNRALAREWYAQVMEKVLLALRHLTNRQRSAKGADPPFPWSD